MPLRLLPLSECHLERFAEISAHAFHDSGCVTHAAMFPLGVTAASLKYFVDYQHVAMRETRGVVFMGAFDLPDGDATPYFAPTPNGHDEPCRGLDFEKETSFDSGAYVPPPSAALVAVARMRLEDPVSFGEPRQKRSPPPGANVEAFTAFFGLLATAKLEVMGASTFWVLDSLATAAAAQGRGAGRALVEWMLRAASHTLDHTTGRRGVECFLEATEMGRPLYERCGFVTRKEVSIGATRYGQPRDGVFCIMVRPRGLPLEPRRASGLNGALKTNGASKVDGAGASKVDGIARINGITKINETHVNGNGLTNGRHAIVAAFDGSLAADM